MAGSNRIPAIATALLWAASPAFGGCPSAPVKCLPASEKLVPNAHGVSVKERDALVALYNATGGSHWKNRDGWNGPSGTECEWHGVSCLPPGGNGNAAIWTVRGLDLGENGLT